MNVESVQTQLQSENNILGGGGGHFIKMQSLGNDFLIFQSPKTTLEFDTEIRKEFIQQVCHRRLGVGCDQLLYLTSAKKSNVHGFLRIFNADGSEAEACGNGTRCVMYLLAEKYGVQDVETVAGVLKGRVIGRKWPK